MQCISLRPRAREATILNGTEVVAAEACMISSIRLVLEIGLYLLMRCTVLSMMTVGIVLALRTVWRRITVLSERWRVGMHVLSRMSVRDRNNCNGRSLTHADHETAAAALPIHLCYCQMASLTVENHDVKNWALCIAVKLKMSVACRYWAAEVAAWIAYQ